MKIEKILISQPEPADLEKSPWRTLINTHKVDITFFKFFDIVGISASEFRKTRIHFNDFTAVIMNSKNSVDHFFRMAKELRVSVPEDIKYFCATESISLYMQNYTQYRKRKMFFGQQSFSDLLEVMAKHRDEKFLFPCSDEKQTEYTKALDKAKFKYTRAPLYRAEPKDLTHFNLKDYDMLCLFSPSGVRSLLHSYPNFAEKPVPVAAFGSSTQSALHAAGIPITISAPTKLAPSMAMAIENFINGKPNELPPPPKTPGSRSKSSTKVSSSHITTTKNGVTKTKSVFVSKEKYRKLMEEKKAKSAARRAERAAERARREAEALMKANENQPQ
ncbi:MAG: uroporphyrinogen-III synthase [Bacteroidales bacterium]|nr:uroporphyrinogen-III synthase [Bacteroidales bacterium]